MTSASSPAKLIDVANRAGVSTATVSRYVNRPGLVAAETGVRIQAAIDSLGYIPNLLAGGLASSKSRLAAVLLPHLTNSIFNDTIETMTEELTAAGVTVMLGLTGVGEAQAESLIRAAVSRQADAIISTGPVTPGIRNLVARSGTCFIQIWELPEDPVGIAVGFSHHQAGEDIAGFLARRGYRRPHLVTARGSRARIRSDGFKREWAKYDYGTPTEVEVEIPSHFGHARRIFADIKRLPTMPDVVVCGSDYLAQGLIVEAQAAGLRVPDQLAVVGFGNSALAGEMRPTITSVDIDGARIAREAIAAMRRFHEGLGYAERRINVGLNIVARESA